MEKIIGIVKISLAIGILTLTTPVSADQWIDIKKSSVDRSYYINADSLKSSGMTKIFWGRAKNSTGKTEWLAKFVVNCEQKKAAVLEQIEYDNEGMIKTHYVANAELGTGEKYDDLVPGTAPSAYYHYVCAGVISKPKESTVVTTTPKAKTSPTVETPKTENPKIQTAVIETPKVKTPVVETPKTETPKVKTPIVETPQTTILKPETPKLETSQVGNNEYPKDVCGDAKSASEMYGVYTEYSPQQLQYIQGQLCRDAFMIKRQDGRVSIQVASFASKKDAVKFAALLLEKVGSAEVASP